MKKIVNVGLFVLSLSVVSQGFALADADSESNKIAHELLEVSGANKMGTEATRQLIDQQKKTLPDIPESFWAEIHKEVSPDELNRKIEAVYVKNFSVSEMKDIIAFYKTKAGQKFIATLPLIAKESRQSFMAWAMEIRMKITKKLETADLKKMKKSSP